MIRVDQETPQRVLSLVKLIFGFGKGQTCIGAKSRVFISLQSFLMEVEAATYLQMMADLMDGISGHFRGGACAQAGTKRKDCEQVEGPRTGLFLIPYGGENPGFRRKMAAVSYYLQTLYGHLSEMYPSSQVPGHFKANVAYEKMMRNQEAVDPFSIEI